MQQQRQRNWQPPIGYLLPLSDGPRMGGEAIVFSPSDRPSTVFTVDIGAVTLPPGSSKEDFFAAAYGFITASLGQGAAPVQRTGRGSTTKLSFMFPPTSSPASTALKRAVGNSGHWTFRYNDRDILIRASARDPLLPPHLSLRFMGVPLPWCSPALPALILSLAGYTVATANSPPPPVPAGSLGLVTLLLIRLGQTKGSPSIPDPGTFMVEVIPPPSDPHLSHLPLFLHFSPHERAIQTFVYDDPLRPPPCTAGTPCPPLPADLDIDIALAPSPQQEQHVQQEDLHDHGQ